MALVPVPKDSLPPVPCKSKNIYRAVGLWHDSASLLEFHATYIDSTMPFPYKKVLVIGATSGIGEDLATRILKEAPESKIIAVGRRQEKLDEFVKNHGEDRSVGVSFDITDLEGIPAFAER
jgi:NADPH:quinone reductase-like Zn-dependent oxidoreductase